MGLIPASTCRLSNESRKLKRPCVDTSAHVKDRHLVTISSKDGCIFITKEITLQSQGCTLGCWLAYSESQRNDYHKRSSAASATRLLCCHSSMLTETNLQTAITVSWPHSNRTHPEAIVIEGSRKEQYFLSEASVSRLAYRASPSRTAPRTKDALLAHPASKASYDKFA